MKQIPRSLKKDQDGGFDITKLNPLTAVNLFLLGSLSPEEEEKLPRPARDLLEEVRKKHHE